MLKLGEWRNTADGKGREATLSIPDIEKVALLWTAGAVQDAKAGIAQRIIDEVMAKRGDELAAMFPPEAVWNLVREGIAEGLADLLKRKIVEKSTHA